MATGDTGCLVTRIARGLPCASPTARPGAATCILSIRRLTYKVEEAGRRRFAAACPNMVIELQAAGVLYRVPYSSPSDAISAVASKLETILQQPLPTIELKFWGGTLSDFDMQTLAKSLKPRLPGTELSLVFTRVNLLPEASQELAKLLAFNWGVTKLVLDNMESKEVAVSLFLDELKKLRWKTQLKQLSLINMQLSLHRITFQLLPLVWFVFPLLHTMDLRGNCVER